MAPAGKIAGTGPLSSTGDLALPLSGAFAPEALRGYPIDMRAKPDGPHWPPWWLSHPEHKVMVAITQWGLGAWEHYVAGDGEAWLRGALDCAEHLLSRQDPDGAWRHSAAYPHTFPLAPGWVSGMAQGQAASLLARLHGETGDDRYPGAIARAVEAMLRPSAAGGCAAELDGGFVIEEYPTAPPSLVLNGAIFALWGLHDAALALDDAALRRSFEDGAGTLAAALDRWDLGWWTRYDLFPHPLPNVASGFYHRLHITQLEAMEQLSPDERLGAARARWERYAASRASRRRAMAAKIAFRVVVPRNRLLARRLPWMRARPA